MKYTGGKSQLNKLLKAPRLFVKKTKPQHTKRDTGSFNASLYVAIHRVQYTAAGHRVRTLSSAFETQRRKH